MIGIYKITNKINGKCYIGQSNNIGRRFIEHKTINHETNKSLKCAYKKYGLDNFEFEILEECNLEDLDEREIFYIEKIKPEYNRTKGGTGAKGHILSNKTKEILRQKGKEYWNNLDEKTKERIINQNLKRPKLGHKVSQETREKLRQWNLGKKQSKETIEKRKQTMLEKKKNGYVQTNKSHNKKVICIEKNEIYNSVKEAGEKNGVKPTIISGVLKGRYKTSKGLHFKYYQEESSVTTNPDECKGVE